MHKDIDYYKILKLPKNSSIDEVKKRYRELAKIYHPDINHSPDAEEKFKEINNAYNKILEAKESRKRKRKKNAGKNKINKNVIFKIRIEIKNSVKKDIKRIIKKNFERKLFYKNIRRAIHKSIKKFL